MNDSIRIFQGGPFVSIQYRQPVRDSRCAFWRKVRVEKHGVGFHRGYANPVDRQRPQQMPDLVTRSTSRMVSAIESGNVASNISSCAGEDLTGLSVEIDESAV